MAWQPESMTRDERSCLVYLETCAVDAGGLVEGVRMNGEDHAAIARFSAAGLLRFERIPSSLLGTGAKDSWTHIVELLPDGWALAHRLRQGRVKRGPFATICIAELVRQERWPAEHAEHSGEAAQVLASSPGCPPKSESDHA